MATTTKPAAHDFSYLDRLEAQAKAAPKRPYNKFCTAYDSTEFSIVSAPKPAQAKQASHQPARVR